MALLKDGRSVKRVVLLGRLFHILALKYLSVVWRCPLYKGARCKEAACNDFVNGTQVSVRCKEVSVD